MSVLFATCDAVTSFAIGLATSALDPRVGQLGTGTLFLVTVLSSILAGPAAVKLLGCKRGLLLGLGLQACFAVLFAVAAQQARGCPQQWFSYLLGAVASGTGSGLSWTSQGAFFKQTVGCLSAPEASPQISELPPPGSTEPREAFPETCTSLTGNLGVMSGLPSKRQSRTRLGSMLRSYTSTASVLDRLLEAASHSPAAFLRALEHAAIDLQVEKADRSYRHRFSDNYKLLFPGEVRCYDTHVLDACQEGRQDIWVNGSYHECDSDIKKFAKDLRECFDSVGELLNCWSRCPMLGRTPRVQPLFARLDKAWALFEEHYISWLIQIEAQSLAPLLSAISLERELFTQECHIHKFRHDEQTRPKQAAQSPKHRREPSEGTLCFRSRELSGAGGSPCSSRRRPSDADNSPCSAQKFFSGEDSHFDSASGSEVNCSRTESKLLQHTTYSSSSRRTSSACGKMLDKLANQVAELNSLANVQGRGRKDLAADVLHAAADVLDSVPTCEGKQREILDEKLSFASASAKHVLASRILRSFSELRSYLATMHDQLKRLDPILSNNGQLVKLLAAWEDAWELGARFLLKPEILKAFCEVSVHIADAQRFSSEFKTMLDDSDAELFLILPRIVLLCCLLEPANAALPAIFVPHHFGQEEQGDANCSEQWKTLQQLFEKAIASLEVSSASVWEALARRAILGAGSATNDALEGLMLTLEGLSMELQRHRPEEWNQCCSVILQCIEATADPTSS
eukprot:TRINITY_DN12937_c0_g1_i1.p1 TRINITY_DN12937_c0_g1~~TRINITY_DN12937_c0_g1_i1.p1  ORF type:complete len:806 (-),score=148.71 TRINITY_DN12937_c0_g1_i1:81-2303(-)